MKTHIIRQHDAALYWAGGYWTDHRPSAQRYTWPDCMELSAKIMEGECMMVQPEVWRTYP